MRSFDRLKMTGGLQNRREPLVEAVYAAIDAFDEENDDMDAYINLKEFEVVELNDVC